MKLSTDISIASDPTKSDSDNDGLPDKLEIDLNLNPTVGDDALEDLDQDGYCNLREFVCGSDLDDGSDTSSVIADIDEDEDTDGVDILSIMDELGRKDCDQGTPCQCDFNLDNKVNFIDLLFFSEDFGR